MAPAHQRQKHLSLALGSGGARGLAQIGVLHWLEENRDLRIKSIAGSSMGALVGGIYAAGKLDIYEEWVTALTKRDVFRLLDFAYSRSGLFSGDRLMQKLRDMLGDIDIEDLPVSFTAVATDLERGREVWLNQGSLFDAIRASIAIPTIFTPVNNDGRVLVDGGVINPIPVAPTLRDGTDICIAVTSSGREEEGVGQSADRLTGEATPPESYQKAIADFIDGVQEKLGMKEGPEPSVDMFDVVSRSIEAMQNSIARFRMAAYNPEYLIEIPMNACGLFDFHRAREMIELGYERAERVLRDS
ncbi:patatin-like phospholipase family protein [Thioalkalivibrio thiocyanodenitrificans]|uniref:patatin-like phospholipase family protein n=1 Tax=Thioalkalivibrio thiocyanodenitrificans TaxID=243063 RepID=UPI0003604C01|nr:patatin-like phospholipase family protein [Thioalkalivibrio thiocyanodenitrificans]